MENEIYTFIESHGTLSRLDGNHYNGRLGLCGTGITSLPDGLTVGGSLDLEGCTGITSLPDGLTVGGSLYLDGCTGITSLPDGLTVGCSLYLDGCTGITSLPDGLTVGCSLDLEGCTGITSLPDGLTVGGYLDLRGTGITSLPDGLTVGCSLDLRGTGITSLPDGLTVGGSLYLDGCTGITSLPDGLTVGGSLDLRGTGITSLPDGLTVGGSLDLEGCTGITSLPDGLTVGGYLDLRGTGITSMPDGLTVGGSLDLRGTGIQVSNSVNRNVPSAFFWRWRNRMFVKADGLFHQVIAYRGNVYKVREIGSDRDTFLVTDGSGRWAHGNTLKEAREDLIFKISNRDKSRYEGLPLDYRMTFEEAIECYRVVTGACSAGTKNFITRILPQNAIKESYTIGEIIELTRGQYGSTTFEEFFK